MSAPNVVCELPITQASPEPAFAFCIAGLRRKAMRTDTYHQGNKPMSSILDGVNRRTQLAGYNRLELLLFFLDGGQHYGINVFKVHEVIQRPPMTRVPNANPTVVGMATLRGKTIPVQDLALDVGHAPMPDSDQGIVIVTEYNR